MTTPSYVVSLGDYFNKQSGSDQYSWAVVEILNPTLVRLETRRVLRFEPKVGTWRTVEQRDGRWVFAKPSKYAYLDRYQYNGATKGPEYLDPHF